MHRKDTTFSGGIVCPKCLNSTSNVMRSSQHFSGNSKFMIMDYLPFQCKFPIQNCFFLAHLRSTKILFFIAVAHVLSSLWQLIISIDVYEEK